MEEVLKKILDAIESAEPSSGNSRDVAAKIKGSASEARVLEEVNDYDEDEIDKRKSLVHSYPETENLRVSELSVIFNDYTKKAISYSDNYDKALAEVRTYAASLRAKIQQLNRNQTMVNHGLAEGDFDTSLLVDAIVGSKNVYKEEHKIINTGACIGLLIDESGSMNYEYQWFKAMKIAVLFERALEGVNKVDFYCYGHTTEDFYGQYGDKENSTVINIYYEGRKTSNRKVLGKISSHTANRDGHAILETIGRMRQKVKLDVPIILFMISDGEPSATVPHGYNGVTYTKKAVDTVEKYSNTTVVHIAIDKGIPSQDMFNTFVEFSDHSKLVRDIGGLLKKIMIKQQKAVVI